MNINTRVLMEMKPYIIIILFGFSFLFAITQWNGCRFGRLTHTKGMEVKFKDGNLLVPRGAKITVKGKEYKGSTKLPENQLCGITHKDQTYLYFTGMPSAELSEETSRRAVGHFIARLMFDEKTNNPAGSGSNYSGSVKYALDRMAELLSSHSTSLTISNTTSVSPATLSTGLTVEKSGNGYKVTNELKRTVLIRQKNRLHLLKQRGDLVEPNWTGLLTGENFLDFMKTNSIQTKTDEPFESYGASVRMVGVPFLWGKLLELNNEAVQSGADIGMLAKVNVIDYSVFIMRAMEEIAGLFPAPVADCFVQSFIASLMSGIYLNVVQRLITDDNDVHRQELESIAQNLFNGFATCAGLSFASGPVKKAFDIASALLFILDDYIISMYESTVNQVYEVYPFEFDFANAAYQFRDNKEYLESENENYRYKFVNGSWEDQEILYSFGTLESVTPINFISYNHCYMLYFVGAWGGGNAVRGRILIMYIKNNQIHHLQDFLHYPLESPVLKDNNIIISDARYDDGDLNCCPSIKIITTFSWNGKQFIEKSSRKIKRNI